MARKVPDILIDTTLASDLKAFQNSRAITVSVVQHAQREDKYSSLNTIQT